jgi:hypothetical protein
LTFALTIISRNFTSLSPSNVKTFLPVSADHSQALEVHQECFQDVVKIGKVGEEGISNVRIDTHSYLTTGGEGIGEDEKRCPRGRSNDDVWDKYGQAIASCAELIQEPPPGVEGNPTRFRAFFPVLVVPDGTLWKVDYGADGSQLSAPMQCEECHYYLGKKVDLPWVATARPFTITHLFIFTETGLRNGVIQMDKFSDQVFPRWLYMPRMRNPYGAS